MKRNRSLIEEGLPAPWTADLDELLLDHDAGAERHEDQKKEAPDPCLLGEGRQQRDHDEDRDKEAPVGPLQPPNAYERFGFFRLESHGRQTIEWVSKETFL